MVSKKKRSAGAAPSRSKAAARSAVNSTKVRPTKPVQARSIERFDLLLQATDELLSEREPENVGIYDIAERARVAPASAYHFLPSKEAAFVALAERYLRELAAVSAEPLDALAIRNWPDLFELAINRAVAFYNRRPVFRKLFLGGGRGAGGSR